MISNAIIYRLHPTWTASAELLDEALAALKFAPCGPTQERAIGFIPPRGEEHGALVEAIGGHWIIKLMTETKAVPGPVVKRKVAEKAEQIEQTTGRKPGRKERKALAEDVLMELLPAAFPKQSTTTVWIDPTARLLVVDAASQARADDIATTLVQAVEGLSMSLLNTVVAPQAAMTAWLADDGDVPEAFSVGSDCQLESSDERKSVVKFTHHNLVCDKVRGHLDEGKLPTRLALNWQGRVSFVLTEGTQLKRIEFLDGVFASEKASKEEKADAFDADVAIMTGELSELLPALIEALGGEPEAEVRHGDEGAGQAADTYIGDAENDPLYDQAVAVVKQNRRGSISLVQRHLRVGYNRAARLLERMEGAGIVSAMASNGGREVIAA